MLGGDGRDHLNAGVGNDTIWGGSGKDVFYLNKGSGYDWIMDFENNSDVIVIGDEIKSLRVASSRGDAYLYDGRDLLARVLNMGGDLEQKYGMLT